MIRAANLTKAFGARRAVDGLSFEIPRGRIVGLLGPNGAGKTTTMRLLTGYLRADAGRAEIAGFDVAEDSLSARARLGYLPENNPLYDELEVVDSLLFTARLRGLPPERAAERARSALRRCGLRGAAGKRAGELSRGYRQRLGLAQAIVHEPDVLVLDEPTSGLDPNQIDEVRALIRELGRDKTVLLSTHILQEAAALCDRVLIISAGALAADGPPNELAAAAAAESRVAVLLKAPADAARAALGALRGALSVSPQDIDGEPGFCVASAREDDLREDIFRLAAARGWPILALRRERASLEEVFRRLTRP